MPDEIQIRPKTELVLCQTRVRYNRLSFSIVGLTSAYSNYTRICCSLHCMDRFPGRPTRFFPHAKMLLVPIKFVFSLLGRLCSGRLIYIFTEKCDFSRLFHTERHTYRLTVVLNLFLVDRICPLMQEHFLGPQFYQAQSFCYG